MRDLATHPHRLSAVGEAGLHGAEEPCRETAARAPEFAPGGRVRCNRGSPPPRRLRLPREPFRIRGSTRRSWLLNSFIFRSPCPIPATAPAPHTPVGGFRNPSLRDPKPDVHHF